MARYANQPVSELLHLSMRDFRLLHEGIVEIIRIENGDHDED